MKRSYSGYLYIVLCAVIFSTMEVMLKTVHGVFAPMQITCLRFLIGGLPAHSLCPALDEEKRAPPSPAPTSASLRSRAFCAWRSRWCSTRWRSRTPRRRSSPLSSPATPSFVTVLASLLLHERIRRNHIIALALELLAVSSSLTRCTPRSIPTGALLAIASALVFSFYSVVGKKRTPRFGGIAVTCFSFLFGSVELLAVLLLGRTAAVGGLFASLGLDIFVNVPLFSGIPLLRAARARLHLRGSIRRQATSAT